MEAKEFGQRVYRMRMARKWTQEMCADRAGISVRTLQMIESYSLKRPTVETTEKLASAFQCSWNDLLGALPPDRTPFLSSSSVRPISIPKKR